MPRIIFVLPFSPDDISGGLKTSYRHVEVLTELGFDAEVFAPYGAPTFFDTRARTVPRLDARSGDVVVLSEVLSDVSADIARMRTSSTKVLFCQSRTHALFQSVPAEQFPNLGFAAVAGPSLAAKAFLERTLGFADAAVLPPYVDADMFCAAPKSVHVSFSGRKLAREAAIIRRLVALRHPRLDLEWCQFDGLRETEVAAALAASEILLSLAHDESLGLVALEAMASAAIPVGFDGYGGREFATPHNGVWLPPDHLDEVADAIAETATQLADGDPRPRAMRVAGRATAVEGYSKECAANALKAFFSPLV